MTTGEPKGVKLQGGLLEVITREVEIECLPDEIPEYFTVDVTELMIGQNLRASDIPLSGSMKLVSAPSRCGARGRHEGRGGAGRRPRARWRAATPAEPEVIKKGKKEEERSGRRDRRRERRSSCGTDRLGLW